MLSCSAACQEVYRETSMKYGVCLMFGCRAACLETGRPLGDRVLAANMMETWNNIILCNIGPPPPELPI